MANRPAALVKNELVGNKWRHCKVLFHNNGSVKAVVFKGKEIPHGPRGGHQITDSWHS